MLKDSSLATRIASLSSGGLLLSVLTLYSFVFLRLHYLFIPFFCISLFHCGFPLLSSSPPPLLFPPFPSLPLISSFLIHSFSMYPLSLSLPLPLFFPLTISSSLHSYFMYSPFSLIHNVSPLSLPSLLFFPPLPSSPSFLMRL